MSYHRFTNLREVLNGDLSGKIMDGIESRDMQNLDCNCKGKNKNGCDYGGFCRDRIVVYENKCKLTGKCYVGQTQQHYKSRMQGHHGDVIKCVCQDIKSDSCARHFGSQLKLFIKTINPNLVRNTYTSEILWQGSSISTVNSFGTAHCQLCNRERLEILKRSKKNPNNLVNSCNEIFGACRHHTKFHKCVKADTSTDEATPLAEKVTPRKVTTEV